MGNFGYFCDCVVVVFFDEVFVFSKNNLGSILKEVYLVVYDKDIYFVKVF